MMRVSKQINRRYTPSYPLNLSVNLFTSVASALPGPHITMSFIGPRPCHSWNMAE